MKISELKEPFRSQAIENTSKDLIDIGGCLLLEQAFTWLDSPQGYDYWEKINKKEIPFDEYFDVTLNPFTKEIKITHFKGDYEEEVELFYKEIDEWNSFKTSDLFDIHVHYDKEMTVSIYRVDENIEQYYSDSIEVNLTIKINEN